MARKSDRLSDTKPTAGYRAWLLPVVVQILFFGTTFSPMEAQERPPGRCLKIEPSALIRATEIATAKPPTDALAQPPLGTRVSELGPIQRAGIDEAKAPTIWRTAYSPIKQEEQRSDVGGSTTTVRLAMNSSDLMHDHDASSRNLAKIAVTREILEATIRRLIQEQRLADADLLNQALAEGVGQPSELQNQATTLDTRKLGHGLILTAVHEQTAMGDGALAFGEIEDSRGDWRSAFLYFDEAEDYQIFYSIPPGDSVRDQYLNNLPCYITTLGDVGYILFMDERPWIGRVETGVDGVSRLPFFPEDFRYRPRLERQAGLSGPRQATAFQQELEDSTLVAGLYSWADHLYLLAKEVPAEDGEATAWWLVKLDPKDGRELARARLPTVAANLTIEPGDDLWRLTERGPVEGIGKMHAPHSETISEVQILSAWVADLTENLDPEDCTFVISSLSP